MRKPRYGGGKQEVSRRRNWGEGTGIMGVKSRLCVRWGIEKEEEEGKDRLNEEAEISGLKART